ncbi:hypothetical protein V499_06761 [Pseudogymnoascus sp. VKM F-103]|uniref:protein-ribulosamine 3-kinase n=1 Tax=Pseudogymnoascus verrucosus TaxID=342668 RepID=A0A1B8GHL5_9PEZI|nr:uncharacterized protein VE01_06659 [Pseudogymnoascus verrucosus]KFY73117.1 hypothetical protein V499_06761 [Pseudogymnoascus sp. VKM F-103]OBT95342.2 hypothetical protein VE01_06659 [Pseudogymnoascus verrucosus]
MPAMDSAIAKALSLEEPLPEMEVLGGSGFSSTYKITSKVDGETKTYFVKTGGPSSKTMFAGEHASLNAIHNAVPSFCPQSYGHGALSTGGYFLVTDFLNLGSSKAKPSGLSFAQKLEKLHRTSAPVPDGHSSPQFGFSVPTCCGNTEQPNDFTSSWSDFYANQRLRAISKACEKANGKDEELSKLIEQTASVVVPRLLKDGHLKSHYGTPIAPVVVHGDLWSGNHGIGSINDGPVEQVVYDPSSAYAHSEFEMGIMKMFGGFGGVLEEYRELKPEDLPKEEYDDRVELYELYHHLNHNAIFGGGYRSRALAIMERLNKKYGK